MLEINHSGIAKSITNNECELPYVTKNLILYLLYLQQNSI
jgi:hypothetical protein